VTGLVSLPPELHTLKIIIDLLLLDHTELQRYKGKKSVKQSAMLSGICHIWEGVSRCYGPQTKQQNC